MTINPELQGRSYPSNEIYSVGRESIRDFARAVKAGNAAHFDVAASTSLGLCTLNSASPTTAPLLPETSSSPNSTLTACAAWEAAP